MCQFKSGIAVRIDDSEVAVKVLPMNDSHTDILDKHYVRGCTLGLSRYSTPVELIPTKLDFEDKSCWKFVFDAGKPDWWVDCMTDQCIDQLLKAAKSDFEALMNGQKYCNSLCLEKLTSIPAGFSPKVGSTLYLVNLTSIPEWFSPVVGRDLCLHGLTSIPTGFNPKVGQDLYLNSIRQLPKLFHPRVKNKIYSCCSAGLFSVQSVRLSCLKRWFRACLYHMSNTIQEGWC
jgi:hypothetical protein